MLFSIGAGYMGGGEDGGEEAERMGEGMGEEGEGVGEDGWGLPAVFEEVALGA